MRTILFFYLIILGSLTTINLYGQNPNIDSITYVIKRPAQKNRITKVIYTPRYKALYALSEKKNDSMEVAMNALTVAIVKNKKVEIANAYGRLAKAMVNVKKYDEALQNDKIALGFYNELLSAKTAGNKITLLNPQANIYFDIATIYTLKGDNPSALNNYLMALSILESTGLKSVINETNLKIGNIYSIYDCYELALVHYYRTLKGNAELGVKDGIINSYQKIGDVYLKQNKLEAAYSCFNQSERFSKLFFDTNMRIVSLNRLADLFIRIENNAAALKCIKIAMNLHSSAGPKEMAYESYDNLGHLNIRQGNFTEALNNFYKALEIKKEDENKVSIINSYLDIGNTLINANQNKTDAYAYLNWGLAIAKDIGDYKISQEFYKSLAFLDSITGNIKQSAMHLRMSKTLEDIIKNEESAKEIIRSQLTYEFDKQIKKSEDDRRNQLRILLIFIIGLIVSISLIFTLFRSLRLVKKQKLIIEHSNIEIEKQRKVIEEKNHDITSSITYARRIQQAKLPDKKNILNSLKNCFILFKPKDIVSGDFYFFYKKDEKVFIAAVDCTGHGVPGVIMSMIGSEKLFHAITNSSQPSEILMQINQGIKASLRQSDDEESTRDGMDIALCVLDFQPKEATGNNVKLNYAGANRPLWLIKNGSQEIQEIKATKKAIGGFTQSDQQFESHEFILSQGDTIYFFTDGYADTFGGTNGKKLTTKKLKELLLSIQDKSMTDQELFLDSYIENWKGAHEQIDDILMIGIKI